MYSGGRNYGKTEENPHLCAAHPVGTHRAVSFLLDDLNLRKKLRLLQRRIHSFLFTLSPTLQNYVDAFTTVSLGKYLLNTFLFTVITTALMVVVSTLAAFAFARLEFRGKNLAFTLFLSLMMIPNELVVITNFVTITNLNLRNTFTGLILPSVTSVFYIYLLKENFAQVPDELYYAAKVDGTPDLRYLWKVMIPICKPTLITIAILKVIECWNSYVWPRLITDDSRYF